MLKAFLEDLESRINEEEERNLYCRWKEFYDGKTGADIFITERKNKYPARVPWPTIGINAAIRADGFDKMLLRELKMVSDALEIGGGDILNIRSNYGTGILPSVFGAEMFYLDDSANTLPTAIPFGRKDKVKSIVDNGIPRKKIGLMQKVFAFAEYFLEATKSYPKIKKYVHLYHPDFQGPMDVVEMLWGSSLFLDVYDSPELVKKLLAVVTDTYIYFMKQWDAIMPLFGRDYSVQWGMMVKGHIMLRDDSAMNFSPEMYAEFIRPYDQKVFDVFGGGMIHFCGKGSHYIPHMSEMKHLAGINLSQPHYNDMEVIYANTIEKGLRIIGFNYDVAQQAQQKGRKFNGKIHCKGPLCARANMPSEGK